MGSSSSRQPPKRRSKRRRLPRVDGPVDLTAFGSQHSAYTIEGRIERVGQFARGAKSASKEQWRFVGRLFIGMIGALVVLSIIAKLV